MIEAKEQAALSQLIVAANEIMDLANNPNRLTIHELLDEAERKILKIADQYEEK